MPGIPRAFPPPWPHPGGAWDPLNLADTTPFGPTLEWYRAAELKHCRVAMAAFVGFIVGGTGVTWPGNIAPGVTWKSCLGATPMDTWDNLPMYGKYQIIAWVGLMEICGAPRGNRRLVHSLLMLLVEETSLRTHTTASMASDLPHRWRRRVRADGGPSASRMVCGSSRGHIPLRDRRRGHTPLREAAFNLEAAPRFRVRARYEP